ncbi:MAG: ComF family protein [Clostridia bacterium]|nr:ComF family protein [Clostridia bacterium]
MEVIGEILRSVRNLVCPRKCMFCGSILKLTAKGRVCFYCSGKLPFYLGIPRCKKCGRPVSGGNKYCYECVGKTYEISGIYAPFLYKEPVKSAILRYKKEEYRAYSKTFAEFMAVVLEYEHKKMNFDCIVAVPPRIRRIRKTNYDQIVVLANKLCGEIDVPFLEGVLKQKEKRKKQSSLTSAERRENVKGNFLVGKPELIAGKRVLLVDDVCTTGSTLRECAKMLKNAGAKSVHCIVIAVSEGENR